MARYTSKNYIKYDEKQGGGNRNAIAYGLLQGAGINTEGMEPSEAWDLVTQLNLMENKRWKRTDADKADIKQKNEEFIKSGKNIESIGREAERYAETVRFKGVSNISALNEAVETVNSIMDEYGLKKLKLERIKKMGAGTMASANQILINIGDKIIRNPNAAYRICVEYFPEDNKKNIDNVKKFIKEHPKSKRIPKMKQKLRVLQMKGQYFRHNVIYKGKEVQSVITHEMGHILAGQKAGFITGMGGVGAVGINENIVECYKASIKNGDIKKISAYDRQDPDEFFAECFTMYKMGKEKLPFNIEKMIKGVVSKWQK